MVSVWAGFFCLMYLAAGTIKTRKQLDVMLMLLVGGGAIVAVCALFEWKNGRNLFNDLERFVPLLDLNQGAISESLERGGAVRAYASSQHAIALGAMLTSSISTSCALSSRPNPTVCTGIRRLRSA